MQNLVSYSEFGIAALDSNSCHCVRIAVNFMQKILIRYASRLAKNVAHKLATVCGLLIL